MQITLISQCEKNALPRTRMVLDAFAERIGDKAWQTIITEDGLDALHTELRKTASKSTAVACHWQRSRTRSQLLWIVGKKHEFNASGQVPVNETAEETGRFMDKERWKYLPVIKSLAAMGGLFHDWGKCNKFFQDKLKKGEVLADPHRHEWLSVLFLKSLYLTYPEGDEWLNRLELGDFDEKKIRGQLGDIANDKVFHGVKSDCLKLLMWVILSHHRMPLLQKDSYKQIQAEGIDEVLGRLDVDWGYAFASDSINEKEFKKCYSFSAEVLSNSPDWLASVKRHSKRLKENLFLLSEAMGNGAYRSVLHHSRLCLMLADYNYSSRSDENTDEWSSNLKFYANTSAPKVFKQHLDNHLYYVAKYSGKVAKELPGIEAHFMGVPSDKFLKPSPEKYVWQDVAVEKVRSTCLKSSEKEGFFALNMASTGCGKTIANAKIMAAIGESDPRGVRFTVALGLRTLTLQTGDEYSERMGLNQKELATIIGSRAIQDLYKLSKYDKEGEALGSESSEDIFSDEIIFNGDFNQDSFKTAIETDKAKKMLAAPALVCTIDHLMGATETMRGGRYILPSLRLLSSDIVIDEVDDFTGSDEIAIGRLIFMAGMLGKRVLLSSATIPPSMAEGYFNAYQKGWGIYAQSHSDVSLNINSVWIDEFSKPKSKPVQSVSEYQKQHGNFVAKRVEKLAEIPAKRKCNLVELSIKNDEELADESYFDSIRKEVSQKHGEYHIEDSASGVSVSLGVIRVASIRTAVSLTRYLLDCELDPEMEIRVMAYHSRQVLLMRHAQEEYLDSILKRKGAEGEFLNNPVIKNHLEALSGTTKKIAFIVVATPVEEVGRDHDFDWAIIEPSSYRSFIQMAGRVARHRDIIADRPNIGLLDYNIRAFRAGDKEDGVYFNKPGYELPGRRLKSHSLKENVDLKELSEKLDATPRMVPPKNTESLIGLEHASIQQRLCSYEHRNPHELSGYLAGGWWLTAMPQYFHPFRKSASSRIFCYINSGGGELYFSEKLKGKFARDSDGKPVSQNSVLGITHENLKVAHPERLWLERDYEKLLFAMERKQQVNTALLSEVYGEISVSLYGGESQAFSYNDQLGLYQS